MANTLLGQTQYTYGTVNAQNPQYNTLVSTTATLGGGTATWANTQPYYLYSPGMSDAEKAGKALAILKELQAEGLISGMDSVEKFCEMIDRVASKL